MDENQPMPGQTIMPTNQPAPPAGAPASPPPPPPSAPMPDIQSPAPAPVTAQPIVPPPPPPAAPPPPPTTIVPPVAGLPPPVMPTASPPPMPVAVPPIATPPPESVMPNGAPMPSPAGIAGAAAQPVAGKGRFKKLILIVLGALGAAGLIIAGLLMLTSAPTTSQGQMIAAKDSVDDANTALIVAENLSKDLILAASSQVSSQDTSELKLKVQAVKDAVAAARGKVNAIGDDKQELRQTFSEYLDFADESAGKMLVYAQKLKADFTTAELTAMAEELDGIIASGINKSEKVRSAIETEGLNN